MKKEKRIVDSKEVEVTICPAGPINSKLSLTKRKHQKISSVRGERWVAKEKGQFKEKK